MLDMVSVFLSLLRLMFWPNMWSVPEKVPCALEQSVHLPLLDGMGILKLPRIIVLLCISSFISVYICFTYLGAPMLGCCVFKCYILLLDWILGHCVISSLLFCYSLCFKVHLAWYEYGCIAFLCSHCIE